MTLIQTIKNDQLQARKDRDAKRASLLTTLVGEALMIGKNDGNRESTDAEVVAVVKKFIKNLDEVKKASAPIDVAFIEAEEEIAVLSEYLPKQLSEDELRVAVKQIADTIDDLSPRSMGIIMKNLKERFEGQYDGKMASSIVKEVVS